jgi:peptidyl-Lys metalloendopeptidase
MKKKGILLKCIAVGILLILVTASALVNGQVMKAENLNCRIEPLLRDYRAADRLTLKYTISNTSDRSINILKWNTPLEGINADIFNVLSKNEPVIYIGKTIKRGKPQPEDYATLKPKEVISGEINLGEAYYISNSGDYSIELNTMVLDIGYDSPEQLIARKILDSRSLSSNKITIRLIEDKNLPKLEALYPKEDASPKTPSFVGCSQSQKDILQNALSNAQLYSLGSYLALLNAPANKRSTADRYIYWFGTYSASNYNVVSNHFDAIYKALTQQTITFHCDCNENYYAYVYPTKPYDIYLCKLFWSAPATGTDSQFGTLIHEVSHFNVVASTHDYVYGQTGARNLAVSDPSKAINNADNHEYFSENTPSKPMPAGLNLTIYSLLFVVLIMLTVFTIRYRRIKTR